MKVNWSLKNLEMVWLNRYLCFYIFFQSVQCELGEDVILDILSSRLDHISLTLAKYARKQKILEKRLDEMAAHKNDIAKENDQDLTKDAQEVSTSVFLDGEMKDEFSVIKRAISSEKEYLRNLVESLETEVEEKFETLSTTTDSLKTKMGNMERNVSVLGTTAEICRKQMGSTQTIVSSLSTTTNKLTTRMGTMETSVSFLEADTDNLMKAILGSMQTKVSSLETTSDSLENKMNSMETSVSSLTMKSERKVSFSVQYRPEGNFAILGKQATIKFNKVFYNDGSGYSKTTGVFTVPISGVYQFIFFVEGWTKKDDFSCETAVIALKIGDKWAGTAALAEPMHVKQNVQGGNAYINYFSKGQEVTLSTTNSCDEYSIFAYRTSFHGVLLY